MTCDEYYVDSHIQLQNDTWADYSGKRVLLDAYEWGEVKEIIRSNHKLRVKFGRFADPLIVPAKSFEKD